MKWKILRGLPGYGEILQFAHKGQRTFSEGLVVRGEYADGSSWVGNFQPLLKNRLFFSGVFDFPDDNYLWVVSGGLVYYVPMMFPDKFSVLNLQPVTDIRMVSDRRIQIFISAIEMYAYRGLENIWSTGQISRDDLEVVSMNKRFIEVQAWKPENRNNKYPILKIDLATGEVLDEIDVE